MVCTALFLLGKSSIDEELPDSHGGLTRDFPLSMHLFHLYREEIHRDSQTCMQYPRTITSVLELCFSFLFSKYFT